MPGDRRRCIYCHEIGFVRSEQTVKAGVSIYTYSCGQCSAIWHRHAQRSSTTPRDSHRRDDDHPSKT